MARLYLFAEGETELAYARDELRPHLAECASCRDWLANLSDIELRVPYLPVPPSDAAKARLLKLLREPPLVPESMRVVPPVGPAETSTVLKAQ